MLDSYSEMIEGLIAAFIKSQSQVIKGNEADIRLVLKMQKGVLKALLYHKEKFVRKVEIKEIIELMS
jgi:hypothetical protein